ncbi:MerR family transcripitonal regulator [uncultured Gammaproteobacteria bacterium]
MMPAPDDPSDRPRGLVKSASAFRTIGEVAEELDVPQHVLRFWETKFPQVRPLKRGGGRRYYRPEDVALLQRIRAFLYSEGYTIKGVQRLLRDSRGLDGALPPGGPAADQEPENEPQELPADLLEDDGEDEAETEAEPPLQGLRDDQRREIKAAVQTLIDLRALLSGRGKPNRG